MNTFTINNDKLYRRLDIIARCTDERSPHERLGHVHLSVEGSTLTASAYDGAHRTDTTVPVAECDGPCRFSVPAWQFKEIIHATDTQTLTFTVDQMKQILTVDYNNGTYRLMCTPDVDCPYTADTADAETSCRIPAATLATVLKGTLPFHSYDSLRPAIMGVLMDQKDGSVSFAATDAKILTLISVRNAFVNGEKRMPLHAAMLESLQQALACGKNEGDAVITTKGNAVRIEACGFTLQSHALEGIFPKVESAVVRSYAAGASMPAPDLRAALRRMVSMGEDNEGHPVRLTLNGDGIHLSASNPTLCCNGMEKMQCMTDTEEKCGFAVTAELLDKAAAFVGDGDIQIGFNSPSSPVLLKPVTLRDDMTVDMTLCTRTA